MLLAGHLRFVPAAELVAIRRQDTGAHHPGDWQLRPMGRSDPEAEWWAVGDRRLSRRLVERQVGLRLDGSL